MDFGNQIKRIREENKITQEQMAQSLRITRQAVSNWENNRNLPDIEMLIVIATVYHVSLDQLILGDNSMNNMAEKLIKDGSETKKARMNMISLCVGAACFLFGIACLMVKAVIGDRVGADGMLQEYFFLIPAAFGFFFCGFIAFLITGVRNVAALFTDKSDAGSKNRIALAVISAAVCLACVGGFLLLKAANSGEADEYVENPVVGYGSLKEAEEAAGFAFFSLDMEGFAPTSYYVIDGSKEGDAAIEVNGTYFDKDITLRMRKGDRSVSGIYGGEKIQDAPADGNAVFMEQNNIKYVEWSEGSYCCSAVTENGSVDDLMAFLP